eukprot:SAG31_NODE_117_length_24022_cov_6.878067_8_plen_135_part_00
MRPYWHKHRLRPARDWDVASGECLRTLEGHNSRVYSVAFDASGGTLASGSGDHTVKLWDVASGECLRTLEGHNNYVKSVAFDASGGTLACGSWSFPSFLSRLLFCVCIFVLLRLFCFCHVLMFVCSSLVFLHTV